MIPSMQPLASDLLATGADGQLSFVAGSAVASIHAMFWKKE